MGNSGAFWIVSFFSFLFLAGTTWASPASLTYQGRIVKSDGKPLEYEAVQFIFDITSPDGSCVIYREQSQVKDMTNSQGVFDVPIGAGSFTVKFPASGSFSLVDVFNNKTSSFDCRGANDSTVGGTWSPTVDSIRRLRVRFWDGAGWQLVDKDMEIRSVPFAHYAQSSEKAEKIGPYSSQDLLLKTQLPQSAGVPQACSVGKVLSFDGNGFVCVTDQVGVSGGGIQSLSGDVSSTHTLALGSGGSAPNWSHDGSGVHILNIPLASTNGVTAGLLAKSDFDAFNSKQAALPVGVSGQVLKWNGSAWAPNAVNAFELKNGLGVAQFPTSCPANQTMNWNSISDAFACSSISLNANQITAGTFSDSMIANMSVDKVSSGPGKYFTYKPGDIVCLDQQVLKWNNSQGRWECGNDANAGGTLTSIAVSAPLLSTGGSSPTLSMPQANGSGAGYLSSSDWATFNAKLGTGTSFSGDVSGAYNALSVDKIKGKTVATLPTASGQVLKYDGVNWIASPVKLGELVNATGGSAFSTGSCTAAQTLNWSSLTDKFECQNIAGLDAGVITTGTIANNRLPASATYWQDGGSGKIYYNGGSVGVGTAAPHSSALLDLSSTTGGFLPPRMTTAQRTAIASPQEGLIVFDITDSQLYLYKSSTWSKVAANSEVSFHVMRTSAQALANGLNVIAYNTKVYDTTNSFNLATSQFKPNVAGKYLINMATHVNGMTVNTYAQGNIYKNGAIQATDYDYAVTSEVNTQIFYIVEMNGTTDYLEFKVGISGASASTNGYTYIQGYLLPGGAGGAGGSDNLGNHTASQNLNLNGNWLSGDGTNKGLFVAASGNVGVGTVNPSVALDVNGSISSQGPAGEAVAPSFSAGTGGFTAVTGYTLDSSVTVGGGFTPATGIFLPTVPGRYLLVANAYSNVSTGWVLTLCKNSSCNRGAGAVSVVNNGNIANVTRIVYLNGTTDTASVKIVNHTGGTVSGGEVTFTWTKLP